MSDTPNLQPGIHDPKRVDADGWTHGYCDRDGNFIGYAPYMTLVPDLIPAKYHIKSGNVEFTGNQRVLPKGKVLITDAGFDGRGATEKVMSGLEEDKGGGLAPTGAIPGTAIPAPDTEPEPGPAISPELAARIAARDANKPAKASDKPADKPSNN